MIEGRHFRGVEARRKLGEAIDCYLAEELPEKRDGTTHRSNLPWWKKQLGHLKLAMPRLRRISDAYSGEGDRLFRRNVTGDSAVSAL
jgi:hypothetical protein